MNDDEYDGMGKLGVTLTKDCNGQSVSTTSVKTSRPHDCPLAKVAVSCSIIFPEGDILVVMANEVSKVLTEL